MSSYLIENKKVYWTNGNDMHEVCNLTYYDTQDMIMHMLDLGLDDVLDFSDVVNKGMKGINNEQTNYVAT